MHKRLFLAAAAVLLTCPADANTLGCGADASSYGVVAKRTKGRGPVETHPETLCAELSDDRAWDPQIDLNFNSQDVRQPGAAPRRRPGRGYSNGF
jgi:hypothetical protein